MGSQSSVSRQKRAAWFLVAWALACGSAAAASPPSTEALLRSTGRSLESFWDQLSTVNCVESVQQQKLDSKGKATYRQESSFDYLVLLQMTGNEVVVDESRTPIKEAAAQKNAPLLVTNGFATLALIFHPVFQNAFEYAPPEEVIDGGRSLLKVQFQHVHGARSPSALRLRGHNYPVEWRGNAWIDPESGAIVRIVAEAAPMEDVGLKTMTAEVRYAPQEFSGQAAPYWLPATATIEVETQRQHWRNIHSFSKYRLFSVDVKVETEAPKE